MGSGLFTEDGALWRGGGRRRGHCIRRGTGRRVFPVASPGMTDLPCTHQGSAAHLCLWTGLSEHSRVSLPCSSWACGLSALRGFNSWDGEVGG